MFHRFLQPGHSFLPNDDDFGDAECSFKRTEKLHTIDDYITAMKAARRNNEFVIRRLASTDFFSVKDLEKAITNRKFDINKQKINWLLVHEIVLNKSEPTIIKMKKNPTDDFQTVNIGKGGRGPHIRIKDIKLDLLWPSGKPLSKEKIKDLKLLLTLLSNDDLKYFSFLDNVEEGSFIDDVDGFGESIDFEIELED